MAEVAIDKKCAPSTEEAEDEEDIDMETGIDELPWCVLCNKDGYYRCVDCSNDIYCADCCNQVHKEFQQTNHRIIRYKPKMNNQ